MLIKDIDRIRVGDPWPICFDISAIESCHSSWALSAAFYAHPGTEGLSRIVLLRNKSTPSWYRLILFAFPDTEWPKGWEDAEVLWEFTANAVEEGDH